MAPVPPKPNPDDLLDLIELPPEGLPLATVDVQGQILPEAQPAPVTGLAPQTDAQPAPASDAGASLEQLLGLPARPQASTEAPANPRASPLAQLQEAGWAPATLGAPSAHPPRATPVGQGQEAAWAPAARPTVTGPNASASEALPLLDGLDVTLMPPPDPPAPAPAPTAASLGFSEKTPTGLNIAVLAQQARGADGAPGGAPATPAAAATPPEPTLAPDPAASSWPARDRPLARRWGLRAAVVGGLGMAAGLGLRAWQKASPPDQQAAPAVALAAAPTSPSAPHVASAPPPAQAPHAQAQGAMSNAESGRRRSLAPVAPLPAPKLLPLTLQNVDSLDYASLQAGVAALAQQPGPQAQALRMWAAFRLAEAFGVSDAGAKAATASARRRPTPLEQVARVAWQVHAARPEASLLPLRGLKGAAARLPQGVWVALWAAGRARGASFGPLPASVRRLEQLVAAHPAMADAQVLRAQWMLAGPQANPQRVAHWAREAQAAGEADTHARLLALLVEAEAWVHIDTALGPADQDDTPATRAAMAQAAPPHQDLLWRLRVHRHVRMGDFAAAQALAAQRVQAEPNHVGARQEQARLSEVLTPGPATTAAAGPEGELLQASRQLFATILDGGDEAAVEKPLQHMLGLAAKLPAPWSAFVQAERRGDWQQAGHALDGLLWQDPTVGDPVDDMLQLIAITHRAGDVVRATGEAEQLVAHLPDDDRPVALMAQLAQVDHQAQAAVQWRRTLAERHPTDHTHTLALAMALIDAGRAAEAIETLGALANLDPQARNADFLYVQGRALTQHNPVAARTVLLASLKAQPQVKTYVLLADLEQGRGRLDEAATALRQALALTPDDVALKLRLVRLLLPRGGFKEAVTTLRQILVADPHAAEAAEVLGDVLHEQGALAEAAALYGRALADKPAYEPQGALLLKLALVQLHELHDTPAAERTLRRAVVAEPKLAEPHYYLGLALRDKGADAEAKKQLQAYLTLAPQGAFAGDCQQALGEM